MHNKILHTCRDLLRQGNTAASLDMLAEYCKESAVQYHDAVLLLSAQWKQYRYERSLGLSDETTTPNRITHATLDIIRELEHIPSVRRKLQLRTIFIGVAALGLLAVLIWALNKPPVNANTTHGMQSPILENSPGAIIEFHNVPDTNVTPATK